MYVLPLSRDLHSFFSLISLHCCWSKFNQNIEHICRWLITDSSYFLFYTAYFSSNFILFLSKFSLMNVIFDLLGSVYFLFPFLIRFYPLLYYFYFSQSDSITRCFLLPQRSYVVFPSRKALVINILLAVNMYAGRLPALYYTYNKMLVRNEVLTGWLNYDNVLLIVSFSVLPIAFAAMYWSISFMLFRREFTACPGK